MNPVFKYLEDLKQQYGIEDKQVDKQAADESPVSLSKGKNPLDSYLNTLRSQRLESDLGLTREIAGGATFQFADEIEALLTKGDFDKNLEKINEERAKYRMMNPSLSNVAEIIASIPTGVGLSKAMASKGITSLALQGATEGSVYGFGSGDSAESRINNSLFGGIAGLSIGKLADYAKSSALTKNEVVADTVQSKSSKSPIADAEDLGEEIFEQVPNPAFKRKPLSEAQTAGELWDGMKSSVMQFYNEKVTGVSDALWREVSDKLGARYQRASETALRTINKDLDSMSEPLIPVAKKINENVDAKGALLDYAGGKFHAKGSRNRPSRITAKLKLKKELDKYLTEDEWNVLNNYLEYSFKKNQELNKTVFGANFDPNVSYLHTKLTKEELKKIKDKNNWTDQELEDFIEDSAFKQRSRGKYTDVTDPKRPDPNMYENPIISDMQRIFKMERLNQVKRVYGIDINDVIPDVKVGASQRPLTPSEFMDVFELNLQGRGIDQAGAQYARKLITQDIMGFDKTPHPIVQALSSVAYATTLAGPMSAVLNVADIPMVGAKYGSKAVKSGMQSMLPNKFKTIPDIDLKKAGLNNQHFGEFVSRINEELADTKTMTQKIAAGFRKGADALMKGSGFSAMDEIGKKGVLRGVLKSAADDARADRLADNWGFYFSQKELGILEDAFKKHGDDWTKYEGKAADLAEELAFAGLGQQQLISSAGRPAAWSRNPNLRPLWALRGFVIKQQALALREVVGNLKAGKPEEAAKFLGRYAMYGAGGYAVINEGRQFIFGDGDISAGGIARGYGDAWASLLTANTLGLNDYQFGQIKQNGIIPTFIKGMEPIATDRPRDIIGRAIDVIDQKRYPQELVMDTLPIAKQGTRAIRNINELTGGMLGPVGETAESLLERKPREQ